MQQLCTMPRRERRLAAEAPEVAERLDVRLLQGVIHQREVARQEPVGVSSLRSIVASNELGERGHIRCCRLPNQFGFRSFAHRASCHAELDGIPKGFVPSCVAGSQHGSPGSPPGLPHVLGRRRSVVGAILRGAERCEPLGRVRRQ